MAVEAHRGFTLIHAETGVPIARLRPIDATISSTFYIGHCRRTMGSVRPLRTMTARVEQAASIIAEAAIFWTGV